MRQSGSVPIKLTEIERGAPFTGDYPAALAALQDRLRPLQLAQVVHRKPCDHPLRRAGGRRQESRAEAARRGAATPAIIDAHCVAPDLRQASERHWLARFWNRLPAAGDTAIFYPQLVPPRARGPCHGRWSSDKEWQRAYDEINEFEAQQRDHGTLLIKLYFHATGQDARRAHRRPGGRSLAAASARARSNCAPPTAAYPTASR